MHDAFFQTRAARDRTGDTGHRMHEPRRDFSKRARVLAVFCVLCFGCVLALLGRVCVLCVCVLAMLGRSVFCVFVFWRRRPRNFHLDTTLRGMLTLAVTHSL